MARLATIFTTSYKPLLRRERTNVYAGTLNRQHGKAQYHDPRLSVNDNQNYTRVSSMWKMVPFWASSSAGIHVAKESDSRNRAEIIIICSESFTITDVRAAPTSDA